MSAAETHAVRSGFLSATLLYRIAGVVFILFALGHTFGFLSFRAPTAEGRNVYDAMNQVRFQVGSQTFSYGGWYRGFGLSATVAMLFWAYLCFHLAALAGSNPQAIGSLGWAFFLVQVAGTVMAFLYFGIPPMVFAAASALLVGAAAWMVR